MSITNKWRWLSCFWRCQYVSCFSCADIDKTKIQEDKMRDRLLHCIKSKHFPDFEKSDRSDIVFCKIKKINFRIFCYFRFIWEWHDSKVKYLDMACSDSCKKWYHCKCENTTNIVFWYWIKNQIWYSLGLFDRDLNRGCLVYMFS